MLAEIREAVERIRTAPPHDTYTFYIGEEDHTNHGDMLREHGTVHTFEEEGLPNVYAWVVKRDTWTKLRFDSNILCAHHYSPLVTERPE